MKKKVIIFLCAALLVLAAIPVANLSLGNVHNKKEKKWWSRAVLYNVDFALPYLSRFLYPLGISTNPDLTIIGKNDWLYLGDKGSQNNNNVTFTRRGTTTEDVELAKETEITTKLWDQWFKQHGVRLYKIMLGPNKDSIYPEFLPDWMRPAADSKINTLLTNDSNGFYVDTRPALRAAKSQFSEPLYYQTDAHWNSLGAWVAYRAFAKNVDREERGLHWLSDQQVRVVKVNTNREGDLASYIRMPKGILHDSDVAVEIAGSYPIETEWYDFKTGNRTAFGGITEVGAEGSVPGTAWQPLIVKSKNAMNHKKVLWLCDSFGLAMAPFMAATFTETLHLHEAAALVTNGELAQLVAAYKPDYVFITVVERIVVQRATPGSIGVYLISRPPETITPGN